MRILVLGIVTALAVPAAATGRHAKPETPLVFTPVLQQQQLAAGARKPELTASDVFSGAGEQLKAVTDSQIKVLQRLVDATSETDPEKPDLLFRMAELYAEQERYYNFRARDLDESIRAAQALHDDNKVAELKAKQADYEHREKVWLLNAVKQYIAVANTEAYRSYAKMDQVLFYVAYLLTSVNKEDQARVFFKRLIKDYPQSPYLPHAYLSFAEYFFANRDFENARNFYEKVEAFKDSPVLRYAMYKRAWAQFNLQDFKTALDVMVQARAAAVADKKRSDKQLAREAGKDVVRFYAQINPARGAPAFFAQFGDEAAALLERLAEHYRTDGKFADSSEVYRALIKRQPRGPRLCEWRGALVKNTLDVTGRLVAAPATLKALRELTSGPSGCATVAAPMVREIAQLWHLSGQRDGGLAAYQAAAPLYKQYLARYPSDQDAYDARFYYGELLFKLGELDPKPRSNWFCDAAAVYADEVAADPAGKRRTDAARGAVLSWKNCLDVADGGADEDKRVESARRARRGKAAAPAQPLAAREQKMLAAFDAYLAAAADAPEALVLKYDRARVLYERNRFDEAQPLFKEIAEEHAAAEQAPASARLLVDCLALRNDAALESEIDKLVAIPELAKDAALVAELAQRKPH